MLQRLHFCVVVRLTFESLFPKLYTLGSFNFSNVTGILLAVGICMHPVGNYVYTYVRMCSAATFPPGVTCQKFCPIFTANPRTQEVMGGLHKMLRVTGRTSANDRLKVPCPSTYENTAAKTQTLPNKQVCLKTGASLTESLDKRTT